MKYYIRQEHGNYHKMIFVPSEFKTLKLLPLSIIHIKSGTYMIDKIVNDNIYITKI